MVCTRPVSGTYCIVTMNWDDVGGPDCDSGYAFGYTVTASNPIYAVADLGGNNNKVSSVSITRTSNADCFVRFFKNTNYGDCYFDIGLTGGTSAGYWSQGHSLHFNNDAGDQAESLAVLYGGETYNPWVITECGNYNYDTTGCHGSHCTHATTETACSGNGEETTCFCTLTLTPFPSPSAPPSPPPPPAPPASYTLHLIGGSRKQCYADGHAWNGYRHNGQVYDASYEQTVVYYGYTLTDCFDACSSNGQCHAIEWHDYSPTTPTCMLWTTRKPTNDVDYVWGGYANTNFGCYTKDATHLQTYSVALQTDGTRNQCYRDGRAGNGYDSSGNFDTTYVEPSFTVDDVDRCNEFCDSWHALFGVACYAYETFTYPTGSFPTNCFIWQNVPNQDREFMWGGTSDWHCRISASVRPAPPPPLAPPVAPPPPTPPPPYACTLDFLRSANATHHEVLIAEPDGGLVTEFRLIEQYMLESIDADSNAPYTCAAARAPELHIECLDLAAPSTLGGLWNAGAGGGDAVDPYGVLLDTVASSARFGAAQPCDGKVVGDGIVSTLDMAVLLFTQFRVPPYDTLPAAPRDVSTVQGATGVGARCAADAQSRRDYILSYGTDACHTMAGRRRLAVSGSAAGVVATVHPGAVPGWYVVRARVRAFAFEINVGGLDARTPVPLRGTSAAPRTPPADPTAYAVRIEPEAADCMEAVSTITSTTALYRNVLGIAHVPGPQRTRLCSLTVHLWVPNGTCGSLSILPGSVAMDGRTGVTQYDTEHCRQDEEETWVWWVIVASNVVSSIALCVIILRLRG